MKKKRTGVQKGPNDASEISFPGLHFFRPHSSYMMKPSIIKFASEH